MWKNRCKYLVAVIGLFLALVSNYIQAKPIKYEDALKQELFMAIENGDCKKVKRLLTSNTYLLNAKNEQGLTPLLFAENNNQLAVVKLLKKHEKMQKLNNPDCEQTKLISHKINTLE